MISDTWRHAVLGSDPERRTRRSQIGSRVLVSHERSTKKKRRWLNVLSRLCACLLEVERRSMDLNISSSRDSLSIRISLYSYGPPHMAKQKQDDQLEHTYSSYVRIRDVAQKTCQKRWIIGRSCERGSGISVLAARHDEDDDDSLYVVTFLLLVYNTKLSTHSWWVGRIVEFTSFPCLMKCKRLRLGFELDSPCPCPTMITITQRAFPPTRRQTYRNTSCDLNKWNWRSNFLFFYITLWLRIQILSDVMFTAEQITWRDFKNTET